MSDTFPRQYARTQRFTVGEPRNFVVSPDGTRIVFARSHSGSDAVNSLWVLDTAHGEEREILNPRAIATDLTALTPEEMRRRERARESAGGVVTYATDSLVTRAATVLGGTIVLVDLHTGEVSMPDIAPGIFDVRLSPDGNTLSYVRGRALCIADLSGAERVIASDTNENVSWGLAEFIAAEEMGRMRGYWWSPDSRSIAACRVDVSHVDVWHIADPAHPNHAAVEHRYPAAGTTNATVSLHIIDIETLQHTQVPLPGEWEYITTVSWNAGGLIAQTETRDQRRVDVHRIDTSSGDSNIIFTDTDDAWIELFPGVPTTLSSGTLVTVADRDGARRIMVNNEPATPPDLQVRSICAISDTIVFIANNLDTPWIHDMWMYNTSTKTLTQETDSHGVVSASGHAHGLVVRTSTMETERAEFAVHGTTLKIRSHSEAPLVHPNVRITSVGPRGIPVAIVTPRDGLTTPLPVLFNPYGGPHAQMVVASRNAYTSSQWFADQGFVVVVADGVGTPGKGSRWERAVLNDLAQVVLDDQVEIARALPDLEPRADVQRIGIRGWSFGGYLAALAVLRRGDVFHAAVAGAPVTDWRLYDTHYTERYLGNPTMHDEPYKRTSLINDAHRLERSLLLIHGLADDNVVAAHTLQLSSALLAAGKHHEVLPLSGVTHMTPQEDVAENLLLHQLTFLKNALA